MRTARSDGRFESRFAILSLDKSPAFDDIIAVKTLVFAPIAARQFDALPQNAQVAIEQALARYVIEGRGDVKRLTDRGGCRMRVGEYRVIFDETRTTILALRIGRRNTNTYS